MYFKAAGAICSIANGFQKSVGHIFVLFFLINKLRNTMLPDATKFIKERKKNAAVTNSRTVDGKSNFNVLRLSRKLNCTFTLSRRNALNAETSPRLL